ncbi:MAG: hypothetical protein KGZ33_03750 [Alkaliphilus sp.]|nr:hypothetical protein [Alkaliphilus sp.]
MIMLSKESLNLLKSCLIKHRPDLLEVIETKEIVEVDEDLGNELRDAVSDELLTVGFDGDMPNKTGLRLEIQLQKPY